MELPISAPNRGNTYFNPKVLRRLLADTPKQWMTIKELQYRFVVKTGVSNDKVRMRDVITQKRFT